MPGDAGRGGPLRLLWLIDSLTLGGAESLAAAFARAADPARLRLHVCALKSLGGNPYEEDLLRRGVPCTNLGARSLRDLGAFRRLVRLLRDERIELVHAHLTYASIWGVVAGRLARVPCVATLHMPPSPAPPWSRAGLRERLMCRLLRRGSAGVIAVSEAVRLAYARTGWLDPDRVAVVHNGIECEAFTSGPGGRRDECRRALGIAPAARVVTTVSVLREGKGLEVLLEAVPAVLAAIPDAFFLIVGDGPLSGPFQARAKAAGLERHVRWLGFRRDVPDLLAASDLFVLPSLHDAFPTVLLEAMAAGVPVVATRVGGIPEIVEPQTGRLVAPGDAQALVRAVADLLSRPGERAALGEAGRRRAREAFSSAGWVERLERLYAQALAGAPGSS